MANMDDDTSELSSTTSSAQEKSYADVPQQDGIISGIAPENRRRVSQLARTLTNSSSQAPVDGAVANPFKGSKDPQLDPNSAEFYPKKWARTVMQLMAQDPKRYLPRNAGVSFSNLSVHGFGSPIEYQTDFVNILLKVIDHATSLVRQRKDKIQILHDHNGLLRRGEMLLVLGRPGR